MPYLCCLPGLLCGLAACVTDMRRRLVPRRLIIAGVTAQLAACMFLASSTGKFVVLLHAITGLVCATGIQFALALIRPGALGLGDVTACALIGCMLGVFGTAAFISWWLFMGFLGLVWIDAWRRSAKRHPDADARVPFVPVIVASGLLAVATSVIGR